MPGSGVGIGGTMVGVDWAKLLGGLKGLPYGGEAVDQLSHARQCAGRAIDAGADTDCVVAAALHDIGRARCVAARFTGMSHEEAGARFCAETLPERVAWLVGAHVAAKRFLVADDPAYLAELSPASVRSLIGQGGPMRSAEAEAFAAHPWAEEALDLRCWDEAAKDPAGAAPELGELVALIDTVARGRC